ncbi:sensor histidine kinase [Aureimonas pseudogalii]|uniref:histidine kinase n=1 Tax=Aureimonas pseudogalii TaxID=1744844 RepID=A0A7W6H4N3_9HYPH|nr:HAMP domain-containing sensor histidine kinase [Aureimonas pseudogalii]MBB3997399.1 signal transduction histidine kinase [Aureimonas pseudogalii]
MARPAGRKDRPADSGPPRPLRFRSLRSRLVLSAAVFVLAAIVVTGLVISTVLDRFVRGEVTGRLDLQVATIAGILAAPPPPPEARRAWPPAEAEPEARREPGRREARERRRDAPPPIASLADLDGPPFDRRRSGWYWRVTRDGVVIASSRSLGGGELADVETPREEGPAHRLGSATGPGGEALVTRSALLALPGGAVEIVASAPHAAIADPLRDATLTVAATLALLGAALIAAIVVQVRFGLAPLEHLRHALGAVRRGEAERIEGPQPTELAPLADELNALIEQDAATLRQARLHVANLAHGLKTPLATLSAAAERMPDEAARADLLALTGLMDRRIRHHLRRARSAALGGPTRQRSDLAAHAGDLAAMLAKFHAGAGIAIETGLEPGLAVAVDPEDCDEMLGNLLDNACRHARSRVVLATGREGREAFAEVRDDGAGLTEGEIEAVLQPGRRLDETTAGHGFGLPITAEIVELYGGRLTLSRAAEGGLSARLTLPVPAG